MPRAADLHKRCRAAIRERWVMWAAAESRRYQAGCLLGRFVDIAAEIEAAGLLKLARARKAAHKAMPRIAYQKEGR